jgi:hydroxypyruvate isomerase
MNSNLSRRPLKGIFAGTVSLGILWQFLLLKLMTNVLKADIGSLKGNINHSVASWCFNDFDLIPL